MKTGNPLADMLFEQMAKHAAETFNNKTGEFKTKIKDFDFEDMFKKFTPQPNYKKSLVGLDGIYTITVDVPGIPKNEFKVKNLPPFLTINADYDGRKVSYKIEKFDDEVMSVKLELGVLTVTLKEVKRVNTDIKID